MTSGPARVRPYLGTDDRRRALLDAAMRRFASDGYGGLTVQAVASEARVSRRLAYNHFSDRVELCAALFEDRAERYLSAVDGALAELHDPAEAFGRAFDVLLDIPPADQRVVRLLVADRLPDLAAVQDRFRRHVEARWLVRLDPAGAPGDPGRRSDRRRARAVLWTITSGVLALADEVARGTVPRSVAREIAAALARSLPPAATRTVVPPPTATAPG